MRTLIVAASLLSAVPSQAQAWRSYVKLPPSAKAAAACQALDEPKVVGDTQGYADSFDGRTCFVSIGSMSTFDLVYRAHFFFSHGLMMVFNSYGGGSGPGMTSAREFYFFPRSGALRLSMDERSQAVSVLMPDGGRVHFNPATAQIKSLDRGAVQVAPRIDPVDRGGVEIPSYSGLMLDGGFRLGESPTGRPEGDSTFRDAQGHTCAVKNKEIFAYTPDGEHALKFDDAQLSTWLKTRCPAINPGF